MKNGSTMTAAFNLLRARFLGRKIPLLVGWSLTNRCNLACSYCTCWKVHSQELDTRQAFAVIDELSTMGTYGVNFTGGEPLIRDDIGDIVSYAKSKGLRVNISSNGSLLPQRIGQLKKADSLTLSFDGRRQEHDGQRCAGSHAQVVEAVKSAKENGLYVRLHSVLTKNNTGSVPFILDFAEGQGLAVNFAVVEFDPFSEKEKIGELLPAPDALRKAVHILIERKRGGDKSIGNSLKGLEYLAGWPDYRRIDCCAGKVYCRIESNGDVYPCANLVGRSGARNCAASGFRDSFMNLKIQGCRACWCDTRIEMNYIYALDFGVMLNALSRRSPMIPGIYNR
jgi:MoaA/NifB/PqqE/SkfB family radical SAM enzyme